ncbi:MAG: response regulator [Acidobacteria bacterium]|nr:MAG: response regulator [Acidobacteriota bacterium]
MGHRLLIVDDEEGIVVTMKEYFETYGHQVDVARGREEAESFLDAGSYSLMIADLRLHPIREADGLDLLALVRERFPRTRVVIFTGYATPEVVGEARRLGADAFLQKPQALSDVARVVFALLASPA